MNKLIIDNNIEASDIVIDTDSDLIVDLSNTSKSLTIHVMQGVCVRGFITTFSTSNNIKYLIDDNCNIIINKLAVDSSDNITINLNDKNSKIDYHTSVINYDNNDYRQELNHNSSNTESKIINHCINVEDSSFKFIVDGVIKKDLEEVKLSQDNRIINLKNGKSNILPNLLVDSEDVEASHAAYIGTFNEDEKFYMMSRGLTSKECDDLLIKAFLLNNMNLSEKERNIYCSIIEKINK